MGIPHPDQEPINMYGPLHGSDIEEPVKSVPLTRDEIIHASIALTLVFAIGVIVGRFLTK